VKSVARRLVPDGQSGEIMEIATLRKSQ